MTLSGKLECFPSHPFILIDNSLKQSFVFIFVKLIQAEYLKYKERQVIKKENGLTSPLPTPSPALQRRHT